MANPNPSPETRFKTGGVANPGGKTSAHAKLERESAEMSAKLRHASLSRMMDWLDEGGFDIGKLINSDTLRLFKDSEDRAHGTPKQAIEHTGADRGPIQVLDLSNVSDNALAELALAINARPDAI